MNLYLKLVSLVCLVGYVHSMYLYPQPNYNRRPDKLQQGDYGINTMRTRNMNIETDYVKKWINGTVPYVISTNIWEPWRVLIKESMELIEKQTDGCIRFIPYDYATYHETWLHVLSDVGCWSWIGRGQGEQWLSLVPGCFFQSTIVHELLHTLGFWHEQSRPDRDSYISVLWDNVKQNSYAEFNMRPDTIDTYGTPYDYYSIMHYRYNTFSIDSNLPTMVPKDVSVNMYSIGNRDDLSPIDIMKIKKYYNCA